MIHYVRLIYYGSFMLLIGFSCTQVLAQTEPQLAGKVVDIESKGLEGVSVIVKGTSSSTSTDAAGNFQLTVPKSGSILVFSSVGFHSEEIVYEGQRTLNITLEEDNMALDEVVVVGYGTQRKSDLTGSVASVRAEDLEKQGPRNNDAIDIDGCRRFVLSNSILDTDDDGITLKSTGAAATEDVVITNCVVSSFCNAIKAGTESTGGFRNITISNCVVKPSRNKGNPIFNTPRHGITGISLEIVDGGTMEGVSISNITIEGTECPLYIRLGNRARKHTELSPQPDVGKMRNIVISNVTAYNTGNYSSSITGIPGHYVENLSLSNIQFFNKGGVSKGDYIANVQDVKEDERGYPQPTVWGELPSAGLFLRHAKNVQINGLILGAQSYDPRTPIVAVDVKGIQIGNVGVISNIGSSFFFEGWQVQEYEIAKPLGWSGCPISVQRDFPKENQTVR